MTPGRGSIAYIAFQVISQTVTLLANRCPENGFFATGEPRLVKVLTTSEAVLVSCGVRQ